jgi:hypothetical protein
MPSDLFALLADELILNITAYLHSITRSLRHKVPVNRNILSLASCNKRLRRIVVPVAYSTVKITNIKFLDGFLSLIIETSAYALLVKRLSLELHLPTGLGRARPLSTMDPVKLIGEFQKCALSEDLVWGIKSRDPWANALLLPLLLQNLEVLYIVPRNGNQDNLNLWLSNILNGGLLSNRLQKFSWDGSKPPDVGILLALFSFPSIVEIYIDLVRSIFFFGNLLSLPPGFQLVAHIGASNVERLILRNASILSQDFSRVIQLPRALRALVYKGKENRSEESPILDRFRRALNYVSNTLEYLDFEWSGRILADDNANMWSFHNFAALKILCINYNLIYNFDTPTIYHTAQSLPPTLEVLAMYNQRSPRLQTTAGDKIDFWTRLLDMKTTTCLMSLRLIAHLPNPGFLSRIADLVRSHDVEVALTKAHLESEGIRGL